MKESEYLIIILGNRVYGGYTPKFTDGTTEKHGIIRYANVPIIRKTERLGMFIYEVFLYIQVFISESYLFKSP